MYSLFQYQVELCSWTREEIRFRPEVEVSDLVRAPLGELSHSLAKEEIIYSPPRRCLNRGLRF